MHTPWHGKSPISIAGAIIYITTNLPRASKQVSLDEVSVVCGVAEATIRLIYSILHPHLVSALRPAGIRGRHGCPVHGQWLALLLKAPTAARCRGS